MRTPEPLAVPQPPDLLLFTGKGGTGKTTCAAAVALALAEQGRPAHLLSLDPAHNAGDVLGCALGDDLAPMGPNLWAREADLEAHTARRVARAAAAIAARYRYLSVASLDPLLSLLGDAPGAEEAAGAEILAAEVAEARRVGVTLVVDLPPSGQAWRLLSLPVHLSRWSRALEGLRLRILDRRRQLRHVLGDDTPARAPDGGAVPERPEEDPVLARVRGVGQGQARLAAQLAAAPQSRIFGVLLPDRLSRLETRRLSDRLHRSGLGLAGLIYNRLPGSASVPTDPLPALPRLGLPDLGEGPRGPEALRGLGARLLGWIAGHERPGGAAL